jgi:hypothetical protein
MGFDQKGTSVFCVKPGRAGQWNVLEEGFEKPLASFDDQDDAMEYAQDLADTKEGSRVRVYDENGDEHTPRGEAGGRQMPKGDL